MNENTSQYEQLSQEELQLFRLMARNGNPSNPVYSGDIAAAFQFPHRLLKNCIEGNYKPLRSVYGTKVRRVKHKRHGGVRAMNGYILPFKAMMQLFYQAGLMNSLYFPEACHPEFLHLCFASDRYIDHLN